MFTIIAAVLTIVGALLFNVKSRRIEDFTFVNNLGGFLLFAAVVTWAAVIASILWHVVAWVWEHAP